MSTNAAAAPLAWMRGNRNLLLFVVLILLVVAMPWCERSPGGELVFLGMLVLIIGMAVAANGAARRSFWLAAALGAPTVLLAMTAHLVRQQALLVLGWFFAAAVFVVTILCILREVFQPGSITRERLFACANVYMLLAVLWCFLYAINEHFVPGSYPGIGPVKSLHVVEMAYFSFQVVTQVGLTDVVPASRSAKSLVILQELASVLYMAFVISRLVGLYAPQDAQTK